MSEIPNLYTVSRASRLLDVPFTSLRREMRKMGIQGQTVGKSIVLGDGELARLRQRFPGRMHDEPGAPFTIPARPC